MTIEDLHTRPRWLRTFRRVARPRCRLVCAPHAGGTAQAYRTWPTGLPADVEVHGVQYPGRQDRLGEPAPSSMDDLTGPIADSLEPFLAEPLALFGHSMGAVVAYEVTLELERRHGQVVDLLAVSGSRAPHQRESHDRHILDDEGLIEELRRLNDGFVDLLDSPNSSNSSCPPSAPTSASCPAICAPRRSPYALRCSCSAAARTPDVSPRGADLAGGPARPAPSVPALLPGGHFYLDDQQPVLDQLAPWLPAAVPDHKAPGAPCSAAATETTTGVRAAWLTCPAPRTSSRSSPSTRAHAVTTAP